MIWLPWKRKHHFEPPQCNISDSQAKVKCISIQKAPVKLLLCPHPLHSESVALISHWLCVVYRMKISNPIALTQLIPTVCMMGKQKGAQVLTWPQRHWFCSTWITIKNTTRHSASSHHWYAHVLGWPLASQRTSSVPPPDVCVYVYVFVCIVVEEVMSVHSQVWLISSSFPPCRTTWPDYQFKVCVW